jgi:hypothetical protein
MGVPIGLPYQDITHTRILTINTISIITSTPSIRIISIIHIIRGCLVWFTGWVMSGVVITAIMAIMLTTSTSLCILLSRVILVMAMIQKRRQI